MMSHWDKHAKQWRNIGAPLRPSLPDIQIVHSWIKDIINLQPQPFNVLLLGATPELAEIPWPDNTRLFVIDSNLTMINSILLKRKLTVHPFISIGNWLQLPLPESLINLVIGDGCYSMLAERNYEQLSNEIVRVLAPNGHFFMRFFIKPEDNESLESIHNDFVSGKINNFHILKWRIAMALQQSLDQGVCLNDIWLAWDKHFKPNEIQIKQLQWSRQTMDTIDTYKNNPTFYTFPTLKEMSSKLANQFIRLKTFEPDYQLGERCPTLKLRPI